jgi:hypothetical protein
MTSARDEIWIDMVHFDTPTADRLWDGVAPADGAPPWYEDVTVLIRTATGPPEADELLDEPSVVAGMRRTTVGAGPCVFRRRRARRTLAQAVAMKAAAITTAGVVGVAATAAATGGIVATVATVVIPAIEQQFSPEPGGSEGDSAATPPDATRPSPVVGDAQPPRCRPDAPACPSGTSTTPPTTTAPVTVTAVVESPETGSTPSSTEQPDDGAAVEPAAGTATATSTETAATTSEPAGTETKYGTTPGSDPHPTVPGLTRGPGSRPGAAFPPARPPGVRPEDAGPPTALPTGLPPPGTPDAAADELRPGRPAALVTAQAAVATVAQGRPELPAGPPRQPGPPAGASGRG